jgi:hypothetical protein
MKNRKRRTATRHTASSTSTCPAVSSARKIGFPIHDITGRVDLGKRSETTPLIALHPEQSEAFIPWATRAVERAFSKALLGEARHRGMVSDR